MSWGNYSENENRLAQEYYERAKVWERWRNYKNEPLPPWEDLDKPFKNVHTDSYLKQLVEYGQGNA